MANWFTVKAQEEIIVQGDGRFAVAGVGDD